MSLLGTPSAHNILISGIMSHQRHQNKSPCHLAAPHPPVKSRKWQPGLTYLLKAHSKSTSTNGMPTQPHQCHRSKNLCHRRHPSKWKQLPPLLLLRRIIPSQSLRSSGHHQSHTNNYHHPQTERSSGHHQSHTNNYHHPQTENRPMPRGWPLSRKKTTIMPTLVAG